MTCRSAVFWFRVRRLWQENEAVTTPGIDAVAFVTKGLEDVAAAEIHELLGADGRVVETAAKRVRFTVSAPLATLRRLATVDDVALLLAPPLAVLTPQDLAQAITEAADFPAVLGAISTFRELDQTFSVTVTSARSPLGGSAAIREVAAAAASARLARSVQESGRAPIDLRVFLDGPVALLGVRLFEAPLTPRHYRRAGGMGALRPTVAAAMVRLTCEGLKPRTVWDPFCGSGTVLAEAALRGHRVAGTDITPEAVAAARQNLAVIDTRLADRIELGDSAAPSTWRRHEDADTVLTNMPWGKQVPLRNASVLYNAVGTGIAGLCRRGGRAAVLTTEPDRLAAAVRRAGGAPPAERRQIGLLGQVPFLIAFR